MTDRPLPPDLGDIPSPKTLSDPCPVCMHATNLHPLRHGRRSCRRKLGQPPKGCAVCEGMWAAIEKNIAYGAVFTCPNDTDGDGDCGQRHCPYCGTSKAIETAFGDMAIEIDPWTEPGTVELRSVVDGEPQKVVVDYRERCSNCGRMTDGNTAMWAKGEGNKDVKFPLCHEGTSPTCYEKWAGLPLLRLMDDSKES